MSLFRGSRSRFPRSGRLPPALRIQLAKVQPSRDRCLEYFPCRVQLHSGIEFDRVYVVEQSAYLRYWGEYPSHDQRVDIGSVRSMDESPFRLPARFANAIYAAFESGMGYYVFTVIFRDGSQQAYITGDAIDFIEYPAGKSLADVEAVVPHAGRDQNPVRVPTYRWCLYSEDRTARAASLGLLKPMPIDRDRRSLLDRARRLFRRMFRNVRSSRPIG
jgi:hypothetical protein